MEFLLQLLAELFSSPSPEALKTDIKPVSKPIEPEVVPSPFKPQTPEAGAEGLFGLMQFH